jgi:hypothetical protein
VRDVSVTFTHNFTVSDFATEDEIVATASVKIINLLQSGQEVEIVSDEPGDRDEPFDMSGSTPGADR